MLFCHKISFVAMFCRNLRTFYMEKRTKILSVEKKDKYHVKAEHSVILWNQWNIRLQQLILQICTNMFTIPCARRACTRWYFYLLMDRSTNRDDKVLNDLSDILLAITTYLLTCLAANSHQRLLASAPRSWRSHQHPPLTFNSNP